MAKIPDNRRPYDPAKAARDRAAAQEKPAEPQTLKQHLARRTHLRPPPALKPRGE